MRERDSAVAERDAALAAGPRQPPVASGLSQRSTVVSWAPRLLALGALAILLIILAILIHGVA